MTDGFASTVIDVFSNRAFREPLLPAYNQSIGECGHQHQRTCGSCLICKYLALRQIPTYNPLSALSRSYPRRWTGCGARQAPSASRWKQRETLLSMSGWANIVVSSQDSKEPI